MALSFQSKSPTQDHSADPLYQAAAQEFNQGQQQYTQQNYTQSLRHLQEAQRLFGSGKYALQRALVQSNLALVYHELGAAEDAWQAIKSSLNIPGLSDYPQAKARALDIQAQLLYFQGEYAQALDVWQQAQPIYQQTADRVGQITNQINRAYAHLSLGQHPSYYDLLKDLEAQITNPKFNIQFESTNHQQFVIQKVVQFLRTSGRYDEAIAFLKPLASQHSDQLDYQLQLAELWQYQGDRHAYGNAYFQTRSSSWQCDQLSAEQYQNNDNYNQAISAYERVVNLTSSAADKVNAQIQLLKLFYKTDQNDQAQALVPQISLSGLVESRELVNREIELAQAINCVDERQVPGLLTQAYGHAENLQDPYSSSKIMGSLGGYYAVQQRDLVQAKQYTQAAWAIAQDINAPHLSYQWLWQLGQIEEQEHNTKDALQYYDNAAHKLATVRYNFVHLSQDIQFSFLNNVRPFYREYLALLLDDSVSKSLKRAEEVVTELQLAEVEDFLRCQSNNLEPLTNIAHPDATLIYPILLGDRLDLIAELPSDQILKQIEKGGSCNPVDEITLHCSGLATDISEFSSTLTSFKTWVKKNDWNGDDLLEWSQALYQALVAPLEPYLPEDGILIFVVDGYLQGLPFAALHDGEKYLIEKHGVAVSIGSQFTDSPSRLDNTNIVLAGISDAPDYWQEQKLGKLPNVNIEIDKIAALTPSKVLRNSELNFERFKTTLERDDPGTIHLATHGEFNADPDLMQLFLWDEPLTVNQFAQMLRTGADRNPEPINLLVLSACETAIGDQRATLGMAGTAIRANATSTVASLWKVSDRSTAELMEEFYKGLFQEHRSKVEALRQAQIQLLQDQRDLDGQVRPYNWAAFVLAGDWH
ncbi:MAG: CHAT domain-containing protein [Cyanobacteria bacterium P01_G01_bin.54]